MRYPILLALAAASLVKGSVFAGADVVSQVEDSLEEFNGPAYVYNIGLKKYMTIAAGSSGLVGISLTSDKVTVQLNQITSDGERGTVFSSDTGKCGSAEWEVQVGSGDIAFAPYCCRFGPYKSCSNPIDTNKQLWGVVEASVFGGSDSTTSSSDADLDGVELDAVVKKVTTTTTSTSAATTSAAWCNPSKSCCHPGDWLCRHPGYLSNHPQCKAKYDAEGCSSSSSRFVKRSHSFLSKRLLSKRAETGPFLITVLNHMNDMATQAVSGDAITAFADTPALKLVALDATDETQLWTISMA